MPDLGPTGPVAPARPRRPARRAAGAAALALALIGLAWAAIAVREAGAIRSDAERARLAIDEGRLDDAGPLIARWLEARPDDPEAYYLMARAALALGRPAEAAAALDRARALGHPEAPLERLRALALARSGQDAEAAPILARLRDGSDAPDPEADEVLARYYLRTFDLARAEAALDRWAAAAPDDPRPHLWRTQIDRRDSNRRAEAVAHYRAALDRDPDLAQARLGLAETLDALGRSDEAAGEFRRYLALRPDDPAGHVGAARNAITRGDEPAAVAALDRALELDPTNLDALKERSALALRRGDGSALPLLDRAAEVDPFDGEVAYRRAQALGQLGRDAERTAELARARRLQEEESALLALRATLDANPRDPAIRGRIARWMLDHGRGDEAARWARTVLETDPDDPAMNGLLADYHEARGETGLANFYRAQAATAAAP